MKVALAQINPTIGDFEGNLDLLSGALGRAEADGAGLLVSSELAIAGYPPRDLLERPAFIEAARRSLDRLTERTRATGVAVIVGFPERLPDSPTGRRIANSAAVLHRGRIVSVHRKSLLPTYDVFDEWRYFEPASAVACAQLPGLRVGVSVCEDIWNDADFWPHRLYREDPIEKLVADGAELIVNVSACPWTVEKRHLHPAHAGRHRSPLGQAPRVRQSGGGPRRPRVRRLEPGARRARRAGGPGGGERARLPARRPGHPLGAAAPVRAERRARGPRRPGARHPRLRPPLRLLPGGAGSVGRDRLGPGGLHRRPGAGPGERPRGGDALALLLARVGHRRGRAGPQPGHRLSRDPHRPGLPELPRHAGPRLRRPQARRDRGEPAGPGAGGDADGPVEQAGLAAAHHRQQERAGHRVLHPVRRHVRRPGGHQRRAPRRWSTPCPGRSTRSRR